MHCLFALIKLIRRSQTLKSGLKNGIFGTAKSSKYIEMFDFLRRTVKEGCKTYLCIEYDVLEERRFCNFNRFNYRLKSI